jgi:hypothetical protein
MHRPKSHFFAGKSRVFQCDQKCFGKINQPTSSENSRTKKIVSAPITSFLFIEYLTKKISKFIEFWDKCFPQMVNFRPIRSHWRTRRLFTVVTRRRLHYGPTHPTPPGPVWQPDINFGKRQFVSRVARWYIFKPKIQIWINFGGYCNGIFYVHLVHFTAICHTLWPFGIFSEYLVYFIPFWYFVARKSWQPCLSAEKSLRRGSNTGERWKGSCTYLPTRGL